MATYTHMDTHLFDISLMLEALCVSDADSRQGLEASAKGYVDCFERTQRITVSAASQILLLFSMRCDHRELDLMLNINA